jgi:hypothetical protein
MLPNPPRPAPNPPGGGGKLENYKRLSLYYPFESMFPTRKDSLSAIILWLRSTNAL